MADTETSKPCWKVEPPRTLVALPPLQETHDGTPDDLDGLLAFLAEEDPGDFFARSAKETASGTFIVVGEGTSPVSSREDGNDWDLDFSPTQIAGEGIGSSTPAAPDKKSGQDCGHDFLKVRNRGRRSVRRVVVQTGTRLSIDPQICMTWAEEILAKGCFCVEDMETLVVSCEGNGDPEDLRLNLQRILEVAGLELLDQTSGYGTGLWDARSDVSSEDLAEAIEAVFTCATRLPGTQRFRIYQSQEQKLLKPMVRAKDDLLLGILGCTAAVETILDVISKLRKGLADPGCVTLRTIAPLRPEGDAQTNEFLTAADTLRLWHTNGRIMDGKHKREALAALETLDLSQAFHKEIVRSLEQLPENLADATRLATLISVFETSTDRLVREHLPYARRFAARNVEDGEDPEDAFQIAFTGLQRSTRRFDPKRGKRFIIYCTFWMQQALKRWRADEGSLIRIPVNRHENVTRFDQAMDRLDLRADGFVQNDDLAAELGWTSEEVWQLRRFPRYAEYPETSEAWDDLFPKPENQAVFDQSETERIIADALADLKERQADVIRMRFGIGGDEEMTLEDIGHFYGVTRERIRQIEAKGLEALSHPGRKRRLQMLLGM